MNGAGYARTSGNTPEARTKVGVSQMTFALQDIATRLSAWLAADPQHNEIWAAIGLGLVIACVALLSVEQFKARAEAAEQN